MRKGELSKVNQLTHNSLSNTNTLVPSELAKLQSAFKAVTCGAVKLAHGRGSHEQAW